MSDTLTTDRPKPKARRRPLRKIDAAMRQRIEAAIERMIEALDAIDAPGEDREEEEEGDGYADDEPSLGAPEQIGQPGAWGLNCGDRSDLTEGEDLEGDELDNSEACELEICGESDVDGMGQATVDDEPSLGSLDRRMNQTKWARPDYLPRGVWGLSTDVEDDGLVRGEYDDADHEGGIEDLGAR